MNQTTLPKSSFREVQTVLWRVLVLNLLVAVMKIGLGLVSGILSMVADGFHSLLDSASNVIGLVALKIAYAPPDTNHPYGHRKAETLASLLIGMLLTFAAYEILSSAVRRLFSGGNPQVTGLSFAVMVVTILINLLAATYEHRRGQALQSDLLLADAVHTRSDIAVSGSVIIGLIGVRLGWVWLDAGLGLVIAGLIGLSALKILRQAANVLMDRAALPQSEIEQLVLSLPGVESVERVRSRGRADETYLDLHVRVAPDLSTDAAHSIAHAVQDRIMAVFPQAVDVTIHIEPEQPTQPDETDIAPKLATIAASLGAAIHNIWQVAYRGQYRVELHLEVPPSLSLLEAHDLATRLEKRGQAALPTVEAIITHIEPMGETITATEPPTEETAARLTTRIGQIAAEVCGPDACHNIRLWPDHHAPAVSMHCSLPPTMPITEAHAISETLKESLCRQLPQLKRVMVHVEPATKTEKVH